MRIAPGLPPAPAAPSAVIRWASGVASLDAALGGGLARGRVHEFYAAEGEDAPTAAGFAMALATGMAGGGQTSRTMVWLRPRRAVREGGILQANGWAELGGVPHACLFGVLPDGLALLRAAVDALRCAALGAVIVESWGRMAELDLTASRRLALAAERSGVPLLLLRIGADPVPSAAQTRWQISAAPSRPLAANAPGHPAFAIELLRQKAGPGGLSWRLEWDRDQHIFREAALAGAVVSVPARRPAAVAGTGELRAA